MISPTNHDSCRFLFCIFELFLSHFNAQLNHFPSVDAMLHRCKALPEVLLSRTCTVLGSAVLGSADCSCEVVQSQSWSRVIVVSVAIEFSIVPFFSFFSQHFFDNCSTEWKIDLCPWQGKHPASPSWPTTVHSHGSHSELACEFNLGIQTWSVYTRHVLTSEIIGIFDSLRGFDYRTPWEFWNQRCPCVLFFSAQQPQVGLSLAQHPP